MTRNSQIGAAPASAVVGRTFRWTFEDGPTAGSTYEHRFDVDGSVEFVGVEDGRPKGDAIRVERHQAWEIAPGVVLVSYLSASGWTLTVAMTLADRRLHGVASNDEQWHPVTGRLEIVQVVDSK